jgi:hypothetical protein
MICSIDSGLIYDCIVFYNFGILCALVYCACTALRFVLKLSVMLLLDIYVLTKLCASGIVSWPFLSDCYLKDLNLFCSVSMY